MKDDGAQSLAAVGEKVGGKVGEKGKEGKGKEGKGKEGGDAAGVAAMKASVLARSMIAEMGAGDAAKSLRLLGKVLGNLLQHPGDRAKRRLPVSHTEKSHRERELKRMRKRVLKRECHPSNA